MVACELDKEVAGDVMGWKLPVWQALFLHRVCPAVGGLLVYLILICFDLALIVTHFRKGDEALGVFCSILVTLPAVIAFVFTLASPPPSLQTDLSAYSVSVQKKDLRWLGIQFLNAIFFPIVAIGRYCFLIFWWVEAVYASRAKDEDRTREAILKARSSSPMELYLFLQSFIHAAPHAIVNILDLLARFTDLSFDQVSVQSVSIIVSCLRMASTATVYRRFEREKLCGRNYPWNKKLITKNEDNDERDDKKPHQEEEQLYESITQKDSMRSSTPYNSEFRNTNSDLIQFSPRTPIEMSSSFFDYDSDCSDCSSHYLPPISPVTQRRAPTYDSDDEYVRPLSIIDRVAPKRRDTGYIIEKVEIVPPPVMVAPRPGSLALWAEKMVENAESIPDWLSAPPRRKYCDEVIEDEPDVPHRVPRAYMRGLEPQDLTAAIVHFLDGNVLGGFETRSHVLSSDSYCVATALLTTPIAIALPPLYTLHP
ncbi:unnamed protein product [Arctia plantaginis]|uniref:XK-related protein n=1 Tax=Arctia plantaginis TaxID=874455 RepID=A0A8S0ZEV3_ARCPL|nr:unnamed protein product [Arctia plantaginis]